MVRDPSILFTDDRADFFTQKTSIPFGGLQPVPAIYWAGKDNGRITKVTA